MLQSEREQRRERAVALSNEGLSLAQIASALGCAKETVRRDLNPEADMENQQRARAWRQQPGNADRERATKQAWKDAHPEEWTAQKKASCDRYWKKNRERLNAKNTERRAALRVEVLEAYGGVCNCPGCHVHHLELLTLDHIEGDARHRQNSGSRSSRDFYLRVKKAGFPDDYQALCGSCNLAKSDKDKCPLAGEEH